MCSKKYYIQKFCIFAKNFDMSATKDIKLNGSNLCNTECNDKNAIVHPETCVNNVLTTHTGDKSLSDWLTYNTADPTEPLDGFGVYNGLIPWLQHYYPVGTYTLPKATNATLGGIIVGSNLTIDNNGVLSVNMTVPTISKASFGNNTVSTDYTINGYGTIKLGNDTAISTDFGNGTISYEESYKFPLRLDSKGRAGIEIDASLFGDIQKQANWYQEDNTKVDYIKNKPTFATVATTGSYDDLIDKPSIGQVNNGTLTIKYGDTTLNTFSANSDNDVTVTIPDNSGEITSKEFRVITDINHDSSLSTYTVNKSATHLIVSAEDVNKQLHIQSSSSTASTATSTIDLVVQIKLNFTNSASKTLYVKVQGSRSQAASSYNNMTVELFSFDYTEDELANKIYRETGSTDEFVIFGGDGYTEIRIGDFAKATSGANDYIQKSLDDARPWWYEEGVTSLDVTILKSQVDEVTFNGTGALVEITWKNTGTITTSQLTTPVVGGNESLDELEDGKEKMYYIAPQTSAGFIYNTQGDCILMECDSYITCSNGNINWTSNALSNHYTIEQSRHDINSVKTYFLKIKKCTKL